MKRECQVITLEEAIARFLEQDDQNPSSSLEKSEFALCLISKKEAEFLRKTLTRNNG